jgi:hypothetical protein
VIAALLLYVAAPWLQVASLGYPVASVRSPVVGELPAQVVATLRAEPAEVQVGEPCRLVLEVVRPAGAKVRLPDVDPVADDSWVVLEPRKLERSEPTRIVASWMVLSLEAGDRELAKLSIDEETPEGTRKVDVQAAAIHVLPALAQGEDAPRPMREFRDAPPNAAAGRGRLALFAIAAIVAAAIALALRRRAKQKQPPAAAPTTLDRLAVLEKRVADDPESARGIVYDLSRLLRGSVDVFLAEDRASLVDAEWAAAIEADERVPLGVRRAAAKLLRDSERIKYALQSPTRFALQDMLASARNALEALQASPPPKKPQEKAA